MLEIGNVSWHQTHVVFCHIFALVFATELNSNTYWFKVFPLIFVTYISKVRDEKLQQKCMGLKVVSLTMAVKKLQCRLENKWLIIHIWSVELPKYPHHFPRSPIFFFVNISKKFSPQYVLYGHRSDVLATDKSWYFAHPRPIIVVHCASFCFATVAGDEEEKIRKTEIKVMTIRKRTEDAQEGHNKEQVEILVIILSRYWQHWYKV